MSPSRTWLPPLLLCALIALVAYLPTPSSSQNVFQFDSTNAVGLPNDTLMWVPAFGDYDNDGDLDAIGYAGNAVNTTNELFRSDGGKFTRLSYQVPGFNESMMWGGAAWGDYDNDGDLDFFLCGWNNVQGVYRTRLYTNIRAPNFDFTFQYRDLPMGAGYGNGNPLGGVAWVDWEGDGDLDLLYTGYFPGQGYSARVFLNQNSFQEATLPTVVAYSTTSAPFGAAWADYDMDNDLDIYVYGNGASASYKDDNLLTNSLSTRNSWDTWGSMISPLGIYYASAAWGDYDNDGDPDLLINKMTTPANTQFDTYVFKNSPPPAGASYSTRTFTRLNFPRCDYCVPTWGDFDNDNDLDVVTNTYTGTNEFTRVYITNSNNDTWSLIFQAPWRVAGSGLGDYDGDGDLDLMVGGARVVTTDGVTNGRFYFYYNTLNTPAGNKCPSTGCATFGPPISTSLMINGQNLTSLTAIAAGDIDNDKDDDLFIASTPPILLETRGAPMVIDPLYFTGWGNATNYFQRTEGALQSGDTASTYGIADIVTGDIDGDQDIDALASVPTTTGSSLYRLDNNDGLGALGTFRIYQAGSVVNRGLSLGKLDSDSLLDYVVPSLYRYGAAGSTVAAGWIRNVGAGFHSYIELLQCPKVAATTTGDLDNDGFVDAVFSCQAYCDPLTDMLCTSNASVAQGATLWVCWNSAQGFITPCSQVDQLLKEFAMPVVVTDVNNDTLGDIVTIAVPTGSTTRQAQWYRNLGSRAMSSRIVVSTGMSAMTMVDLNEDGLLDIVGVNGQVMQQWRNLGNSTFVLSVQQKTRPMTLMTSGDLNGDNKLDIVGIDSASRTMVWHRRLQSKLKVSPSPSPSRTPTPSASASGSPSRSASSSSVPLPSSSSSSAPSATSSPIPSISASNAPTPSSSIAPSQNPTSSPSSAPSPDPTTSPSAAPSSSSSAAPSSSSTSAPTSSPSAIPSPSSSSAPSATSSPIPSVTPSSSVVPSSSSTSAPTSSPSAIPSPSSSSAPSATSSPIPSVSASNAPIPSSSSAPSASASAPALPSASRSPAAPAASASSNPVASSSSQPLASVSASPAAQASKQFTEASKFVFGFSAAVTVGDLNNDAKVDIIIVDGDSANRKVTVLRNSGNFNLSPLAIDAST